MEFSCDSEILAKALTDVGRALSSRASLPVLSHVLLDATKDRLTLSATNLEISIRTSLPVTVEEEGQACLPGRLLADLVGSFPKGFVAISEKANAVSLKINKTSAKVNGLPPLEFPKINLTGRKLLELPARDLVHHLAVVAFAAATDESRPILTGILVTADEDGLTLVGVDGFRLSEKKVKLALTEAFKQVLPAKPLMEISRLIGGEDRLEILLSEEENQMVFKSANFEIGSRLLEGTFPDYQKIIPQEFRTKVEIETSDLRQALKVVSVFARDGASVVKALVSPEKGSLTLSAVAAEIGENESTIDVSGQGEEAEVAFNARYLAEALGSFESEKLELRLGGPLSPGVFLPVGQEGYLHLIMPIRIQN